MSLRSGASASLREDRRELGVAEYRDVLRWPVQEDAEGLTLQLGCGVGAVEFAAGRGRDVVAVLRKQDAVEPVLALPGRQLRWVVLTASDDSDASWAPSTAMLGAHLRMTGPDALALPPSVTPHGPVRWIVSPCGSSTRLPRLQTVLSAAWKTVSV